MKKTSLGFGMLSESRFLRSFSPRIARGLAMAVLLAMLSPQSASAALAAIFGREKFYTLTSSDINALRESGFTTLILFVVDVAANGDLNYNGDHLLVQNGVYVGDPNWGARLAAVKAPPSSVYRIEACTGGWGAQSWNNIKNLIASQGTGTNSILYRNFRALKNALGLDAICNDDELAYDASSAIAFGNMIHNMGMTFTLCPYTNSSYWSAIKASLGNKVDAVYLQCYDGGAGNNPDSWAAALGSKIIAGLDNNSSYSQVQSKMAAWNSNNNLIGGFMWQAEFIGPVGTSAYPAAIIEGVGTHSDSYKIANRKSGLALYPSGGGTANNTPLVQSNSLGVWDLASLGGGQWKITGASSGRAVSVDGASSSDGATVKIYDYFGGSQQKITLQDNDHDGYYAVLFVHSGKAMTVSSGSTAAGAGIIQWTLAPADSQLWQLRKGWY